MPAEDPSHQAEPSEPGGPPEAGAPEAGASERGVPAGPPPLPAVSAVPAIPLPRFCRTCGAPWQPDWVRCEACAAAGTITVTALGTGPGFPPHFSASPVAPAGGAATAEARPRVGSAIGLYFAMLAVSLVTMIAGLAGDGRQTVWLEITASVAMSVVVLGWCVRAGRQGIGPVLRPAAPAWFAAALVAALGTFAVAAGVVELLRRSVDMPVLSYNERFSAEGFGFGVVVLVICVQPAVVEELAFRGVVLTSLRPTLSEAEAVAVSALLFMTLHLSPAAFPHTLAMGLAAGFLRVRTGSLLPCILLHFVHNLLAVVTEGWLL